MWNPSNNSCFLSLWRSRNRNTFITVVFLGLFILTFLFAYNVFAESMHQKDTSSLLNAQILFRHGERTPTSFYKNDPFKNTDYWPEGLGQLTNKGKEQLFRVGQHMRNIFKGWLPEEYSPKDLSVRSSYADRCQMSALVLLAGLYPPKGKQLWNQDLRWQPIPINSVPRENDNVIVIGKSCEKYKSLRKATEANMNRNLSEKHGDLLNYLTEHTGEHVETVARIEDLYFTLLIEEERGLVLPSWTNDVFPSKLQRVAKLMQSSLSWTEETKPYASGGLLRAMTSSMAKAIEGNGVKLALYSGHDVTLVSLVRVLSGAGQSPPLRLPAYGAAVVLQLHNIAQSYFVKILYFVDGMEPGNDFTVITVPGCEDLCPWNQFLMFVHQYTFIEWDADC